jgi:hypothetical protein
MYTTISSGRFTSCLLAIGADHWYGMRCAPNHVDDVLLGIDAHIVINERRELSFTSALSRTEEANLEQEGVQCRDRYRRYCNECRRER